jgi:hypothetical protein
MWLVSVMSWERPSEITDLCYSNPRNCKVLKPKQPRSIELAAGRCGQLSTLYSGIQNVLSGNDEDSA